MIIRPCRDCRMNHNCHKQWTIMKALKQTVKACSWDVKLSKELTSIKIACQEWKQSDFKPGSQVYAVLPEMHLNPPLPEEIGEPPYWSRTGKTVTVPGIIMRHHAKKDAHFVVWFEDETQEEFNLIKGILTLPSKKLRYPEHKPLIPVCPECGRPTGSKSNEWYEPVKNVHTSELCCQGAKQ